MLAVAMGLAAALSATASGFAAKHRPRAAAVRQVIVRREPIIIQAVTIAQLRTELRRARTAQVGYERQVAQQYQTIRHLQAQLDRRLQELREANSQRADQLNAQFEVILQAFGLVVFAIIGALLVALSRTQNREPAERGAIRGDRDVVDWNPLQRQLQDTKSALATVESRLRHLEIGLSQESG
jgi:exonuclease VII large subunit